MAEIYKDQVYAPCLNGRQDLTILDIGAHVGLFSIYASRFAKKIKAVEPAKEHFEALLKNTENLKMVECINAAVADKEGELELYHNQNRTMWSLQADVRDPSLPSEKVKAITLSSLCGGLKRVDFMKLDVEGAEQYILGGTDFIEASKKINSLVMENHSWNGRHPNQIKEALKNNGYKVQTIANDANLLYAIKT